LDGLVVKGKADESHVEAKAECGMQNAEKWAKAATR
jgi:hypothetical protein